MAKIKYNVKDVERKSFEQPPPGVYEMEIMEANPRLDGGKNDIEVVLEVTKNNDTAVGGRLWTYINLGESSQWKLAEFTDALGLPETGTLDTDKLLGKKLKVKVNPDSYKDDAGNVIQRSRAGRFSPLEATATEADVEEDPDADEAEGDDEVEISVVEIDGVEFGDDEAYYEEWSDEDVKEEITGHEIKVSGRYSRAKGIAALVELAKEAIGGGDEEEDGDEEEEEGDNYDDADEWSTEDLAAEVEKRELTVAGKKTRAKLIAALREDDGDEPF